MHDAWVVFVRMRREQGLSVAAEITPAQQIEPNFAPQGTLISQAAGAAVARAEPHVDLAFGARLPADAERGAANARLLFAGGHDDFHGCHSNVLFVKLRSESSLPSVALWSRRSTLSNCAR